MTNGKDDDPFSWDVDRVVKELCSSSRTWTPTPRMQFPDPVDLEAKLRDGEYDGELLLHSLTNENDLWSDLGITKGKFKQTIRTAIAQLRTRSPEYRRYERSLRYAPEDELPHRKEIRFLSPGLTDAATPNSAPVDVPTPEQALWKAPAQASSTVMQNALRHTRNEDSDSSAKPNKQKKKKRRLDATGLTSVALPARDKAFSNLVLTEADRFTISSQPTNLFDRLVSGPGAYWGEGKLAWEDLFVHGVPDVNDAREFGWVHSQHIGRAKARWVHSKMQQYLRAPSRLQDADSDDLPLFGESDEEDNPVWDLIEREIEEEEQEVLREKLREQATSLHSDVIDASIQKMIQELIVHWKETKLSIQQRKARKIWNQAQQSGNRNHQIIQLTQSLRAENTRLDAKVKYLRDNSYSSKKELHGMKPTLEPTVFEIERIKWMINVLQSSRAPEKVYVPSRPRSSKKPKESADGGIDIWSEDELDGFIVDDDSPTQVMAGDAPAQIAEDELPAISDQADNAMDVDGPRILDSSQSFISASDGDVEMFDLTQVEKVDDPIALHTPMKSTAKPKPVSPLSSARGDDLPTFSEPQAIAEKGTEYWQNKRDYKRLLVTLISNLSSNRRVKVLESAVYSDAPEELWQDQIEVAIMFTSGARNNEQSSAKVRRDVAMSVAKFFHVFCGDTRLLGVESLSEVWPAVLQKVGELKARYFVEFWGFLRFLAPYFDVVRIDPDGPLFKGIDIKEEEDMTAHQKSTKAKLQKSAQIRSHEAHSSQAREARRLKFRASAYASGGTTGLVINESKEAGQGLIYVHPYIAHRIRPHQLKGVRFMWDEITKDTQKGCLLAHTMGLGKTMQTITLLSALAEAAASKDATISSQIPEHLKILKIVILCPVNVLTNWMEELINWSPPDLLGEFYQLDASISAPNRGPYVEQWATDVGCSVLVLGYKLFVGLEENVRQRIVDVCSIVIGDEAHIFKNRATKTGMAVNSFKTTSRIALTGSPLSNNVKEYYSIIDWVAPGFLGEPGEFNMRYGNPIEDGLSATSDRGANRKAKVLLAALKKLVETKVQRMSMHALKADLPPKIEFIIYVDLSKIQMAAYKAYLKGDLRNRPEGKIIVNNVWALQSVLPLLLVHPSIYYHKLKKDRAKIAEDMKEMKEITTEAQQPQGGTPDEADLEAPLGISSEVASDALEVFDEPDKYKSLDTSYKMMVLEKILDESLKLGDNVLVFSQKLAILNFIEEQLLCNKSRKCYRIDGAVNSRIRQAKVHNFNSGRGGVFLISTTAGGVGLNLHGANRVVIMDSQYNPTHEQQAVGRAYRIGQTKPVFVYWLLCDGTFEKTMQSKQVFKTQLSSRVVDDKAPIAKSDRSLWQWFTQPEEVPHQDTSHFQGRDTVLDAVLQSELTAGISSMETTDTFEEEEEDKELQPDELEQANQMALGTISQLTLPEYSEVRQPSNLSTMSIFAPPSHHSKVGGTDNSSPFGLQAGQQPSEVGAEIDHAKTELLSAPDYTGPGISARPLSRESAPGDLLSSSHRSADSVLLGWGQVDSPANMPIQNPAGVPLALSRPIWIPVENGMTPVAPQTTPLPFGMPGAEQIQGRITFGGNGQPGSGIPNSRVFTPLTNTPQPFVVGQQPNQHFIGAGPSVASGHLNGVSNGQAARPMPPPGQTLERAAEHAAAPMASFKLALGDALGPSMIVESEELVERIDQAMISEGQLGLSRRTIWLKLTDVVQNHAKSAEAMISQQVTAHTLVTAEKDQLVRALGVSATQDPDV